MIGKRDQRADADHEGAYRHRDVEDDGGPECYAVASLFETTVEEAPDQDRQYEGDWDNDAGVQKHFSDVQFILRRWRGSDQRCQRGLEGAL